MKSPICIEEAPPERAGEWDSAAVDAEWRRLALAAIVATPLIGVIVGRLLIWIIG